MAVTYVVEMGIECFNVFPCNYMSILDPKERQGDNATFAMFHIRTSPSHPPETNRVDIVL